MVKFQIFVILTAFYMAFCKGSPNDVRFIVIGDWGGLPFFPYRTPIEYSVAKQMGKFADNNSVQFVLALGDNFYFDGVKDTSDARFQETYNQVFQASSLDLPWYFVAGNHDHNGNVSAQIEYTKLEKRWMFPNYYYNLQYPATTTSPLLEIIMLDTVLLCGNSDSDFLHKQPKGPLSQTHADDQWTWLEAKMKASRATYMIVAGHYPVLSIAEHGPTDCLVQRLQPLLYKYQVSAYFCGHDHNIQHLQYTQNNVTVDYFVSGAANFIDPSTAHADAVPAGSLRYHWADLLSLGSFSFVQVGQNNLTYSFYEANGDRLYSYTLPPRKR